MELSSQLLSILYAIVTLLVLILVSVGLIVVLYRNIKISNTANDSKYFKCIWIILHYVNQNKTHFQTHVKFFFGLT